MTDKGAAEILAFRPEWFTDGKTPEPTHRRSQRGRRAQRLETLYTVEEVAKHFKASLHWVYDQIHASKLRAIKVGDTRKKVIRIPESAIIEFEEKHATT